MSFLARTCWLCAVIVARSPEIVCDSIALTSARRAVGRSGVSARVSFAAGSPEPPRTGTTNASTRRTSRSAARSDTACSAGPSGRLASSPPSAANCVTCAPVNGPMSGWPSPPSAPTGTRPGSNAIGKEALQRAASASAGTFPGVSCALVKLNSPWWSISRTSVPYPSVNLLASPLSSVVVMNTRVGSSPESGFAGHPPASLARPVRRPWSRLLSPYSSEGTCLSPGSRSRLPREPSSNHSSRSPSRSKRCTFASPRMTALMPPALVPERTSILQSTLSKSSSAPYPSRTLRPCSEVSATDSPRRIRLAASSRFISLAIPPIHTARLTPPVNVTASRTSDGGCQLSALSGSTALMALPLPSVWPRTAVMILTPTDSSARPPKTHAELPSLNGQSHNHEVVNP